MSWQRILFVAGMLFAGCAQAELIISAPPRESVKEGEATYGPFAARLTALLGEPVRYEHPLNFAEYSNEMRKGRYDIVFDGPHFTSWRIAHLGHVPIARLAGNLRFHAVALKGGELSKYSQVQLAKVCAIASPNLTAVSLLADFRAATSPTIVSIKGGQEQVYQGLLDGKCNVAVLRDQFYAKKLSGEERDKLIILNTTVSYPNQGISVANTLSQEKQQQVKALLLEGDPALKPITDRFAGKKATSFINTSDKEYEGHNQLLEGVVWGW